MIHNIEQTDNHEHGDILSYNKDGEPVWFWSDESHHTDDERNAIRVGREAAREGGPHRINGIPEDTEQYLIDLAYAVCIHTFAKRMGISLASEIKPSEAEYLVAGLIQLGETTLLMGAPGSGKTRFAIARQALLTGGIQLEGVCVIGGRHNVACISMEEDTSKQIRPAYEHSGADLSRVRILDFNSEKIEWPMRTLEDLLSAVKVVADLGCKHVLIDSLKACYSRFGLEENDSAAAYQFLNEGLNHVARQKNIAIEVIHHYGKMSSRNGTGHDKGSGSTAITAAVRAATLVEVDRITRSRFAGISPAKNNLGMKTDVWAFRTDKVAYHLNHGQGVLIASLYGMNTSENILEIEERLAKSGAGIRHQTKAQKCADVLKSIVAGTVDGIISSEELRATLLANGFTMNTINDSIKIANLPKHKLGFDSNSKWYTTVHESRAVFEQIMGERASESHLEDDGEQTDSV